jgi:hypothetical protein
VIGAVLPMEDATADRSLEFRLAFDVELADAALQREAHFLGGLADAGKDDALARHAGGLRAEVFAARDHVHPRAEPGEMGQDRLVRVRFHREADEVVETAQRLFEQAEVAGQRGAGIDVERRADLRRDLRQRHVLGMQDAVPVEEMVHLACPSRAHRAQVASRTRFQRAGRGRFG